MPARTLRLEKITRHLHADELVSISEWCKRMGITEEEWPHHSAAMGWLDLAIGRAVDVALRQGRARSYSAALRFVGGDFGLCGDSIRRRWERRRAA